jgi:hypothetical protein
MAIAVLAMMTPYFGPSRKNDSVTVRMNGTGVSFRTTGE